MAHRVIKPIERPDLIKKAQDVEQKLFGMGNRCQHRDNFFPRLIDEFGFKIAAEIGVDAGVYSEILLNNSKLEKLYGIDIWQNSEKMWTTCQRLQPFIDTGRVVLQQGLSEQVVSQYEDGSLDFCYIDGDHSLEGIYKDVRLWVKKVKIGGVLAGHDYKDGRASGTKDWFGNYLRNKVKIVMDDFCPRYGYRLHTIQSRVLNWWFIKNKECEAKLVLDY